MLSILIPVYNHDVYRLVKSIHDQLISTEYQFEIICLDDASTINYNNFSKITELSNCNYVLLDQNIGRSAIRNKLVEIAKYECLLFIDSDMLLLNDSYIKKYMSTISDYDVVYGGISYLNQCNDDNKLLRWKYGIEREALDVNTREHKPYLSAKFCNLLIRKSVFNTIKFDEQIKEYGHEDTLFSIEMAASNLKVLHIDNPLLHDGLEDSISYLEKVDKASKNLRKIQDLHPELLLLNDIPLLKSYLVLKRFNLVILYRSLYSIFKKGIKRNLLSTDPNIRLLDFYKLNSICSD